MTRRTVYILLGIIFLAIVVFDVIVWIEISSNNPKPFDAVVQDYLHFYGGVFSNPLVATLKNIVCCILSIMFFVFAINTYQESKRHMSLYIVITITGFLAIWQLWSLM